MDGNPQLKLKKHMTLNTRENFELYDWMRNNEKVCRDLAYSEIAAKATADPSIGFVVNNHHIEHRYRDLFGEKRAPKSKQAELADLRERVAQLELALSELHTGSKPKTEGMLKRTGESGNRTLTRHFG